MVLFRLSNIVLATAVSHYTFWDLPDSDHTQIVYKTSIAVFPNGCIYDTAQDMKYNMSTAYAQVELMNHYCITYHFLALPKFIITIEMNFTQSSAIILISLSRAIFRPFRINGVDFALS